MEYIIYCHIWESEQALSSFITGNFSEGIEDILWGLSIDLLLIDNQVRTAVLSKAEKCCWIFVKMVDSILPRKKQDERDVEKDFKGH